MVAANSSQAFDRGVGPVLSLLLRDRVDAVLSHAGDPVLRERISQLAAQSTEGTLTSVEREEYEGYVRANKFLAILRRQAQRLKDAGGA